MRRRIATVLILLTLTPIGQALGQDETTAAQGWTRPEREIFWNSPVGSRLMPYPWFAALEQADSETPLADPVRLAAYGFRPATASPVNPGGLPAGLSRERDRAEGPWLGVTCAACHVRDIAYRGASVRIEGAGSLLDLPRFERDVAAALRATADDDARFLRFAGRLATPEAERPALRERLGALAALRGRLAAMNAAPTPAGPGRLDLAGTLANAVAAIALDQAGNAAPPAAPVRFPRLWGATSYDRGLVDGSGGNAGSGPLLRNIAQVLATFGAVDVAAPPPYPGSVSVFDLQKIETLLRKLEPLAWPAMLPPIDPARAAAGATVFARACAACHAAAPRGADGLVPLVRVLPDQLGTDPTALQATRGRMVATGPLQGRPALPGGPALAATAPAATVSAHVIAGLAAPRFRAEAPAPRRDAYRATPLAGIWAAAPYLHNGAVPNLRQLLTPARDRVTAFSLAPDDFDPEEVGLPTGGTALPRFDATQPGNGAGGHEYGTTLPEEEKRSLLEFLKTL